eukprot:4166065-Alexandrium_andersonii.AAC.1
MDNKRLRAPLPMGLHLFPGLPGPDPLCPADPKLRGEMEKEFAGDALVNEAIRRITQAGAS